MKKAVAVVALPLAEPSHFFPSGRCRSAGDLRALIWC
jgi:hypothetical protein